MEYIGFCEKKRKGKSPSEGGLFFDYSLINLRSEWALRFPMSGIVAAPMAMRDNMVQREMMSLVSVAILIILFSFCC